jgi:VanZ family protein
VRLWLVAWLPVALWAAVIFGLSSIPGTRLPPIDLPQVDKLAHLLVYAVLGALILRGVARRHQRRRPRPRDFLTAIALTIFYGISDEIHQHWTPNRSPDWHDVMADALGGALGSLALVATQWMKTRVCLMMGRSKN